DGRRQAAGRESPLARIVAPAPKLTLRCHAPGRSNAAGAPMSQSCKAVYIAGWGCQAPYTHHRMSNDRQRLVAKLREHGDRRRAALGTAEEELEAIAELLPAAIEARITKVEVARLSGLSRPTIDALLARRG